MVFIPKDDMDPMLMGNWFVIGSSASNPLILLPVLFKVTSKWNGLGYNILFLVDEVISKGI
jgi:hypothetical protein